ncbi:MAG: ABA4-like family protein [Alphaproteobacteria bacterium]|jgi:hypothetical protein|nr:ABA4-like family protein [Alphaproteobacteria bacterium]
MSELAQITPDTLFMVLNYGVLPFWTLLIVAPVFKLTDILVHSVAVPMILGVTYAWLLATALFGGTPVPEGAGFGSLDGVMKLFSVKEALVAGWAHYLVFDLFIGAWQARDAQRIGLNHFILIPCLALTLLVGPIGLLAYLLIRGLTGRAGWSLFEG